MFGSDGYSGSSSHATVARNYVTGVNPNSGNRYNPVRLNRLFYFYNLVGNVLGSSTMNPAKSTETQDNCGGSFNAICASVRMAEHRGQRFADRRHRQSGLSRMTYPDVKVAATLLRWGNYDHFNDASRFNASEIPSGVPITCGSVDPELVRLLDPSSVVPVGRRLALNRPGRYRRERRSIGPRAQTPGPPLLGEPESRCRWSVQRFGLLYHGRASPPRHQPPEPTCASFHDAPIHGGPERLAQGL